MRLCSRSGQLPEVSKKIGELLVAHCALRNLSVTKAIILMTLVEQGVCRRQAQNEDHDDDVLEGK